MKKWTCVVVVIIGLLLGMGMPVGALSLAPPELFNHIYFFYFSDFNQDGVFELVTFGGEPGGYSDKRPEYKIYCLVNGEVRTFAPSQDSLSVDGAPRGYRSNEELKWFYSDHREYRLENANNTSDLIQAGWGRIHEVIFDFDNYTYRTVELDHENNDWVARDKWSKTWQLENQDEPEKVETEVEGKLTKDTILQYLLDKNPKPPTSTAKTTEQEAQKFHLPRIPTGPYLNFRAVIPLAIALAAAIIVVVLLIRKRRT